MLTAAAAEGLTKNITQASYRMSGGRDWAEFNGHYKAGGSRGLRNPHHYMEYLQLSDLYYSSVI